MVNPLLQGTTEGDFLCCQVYGKNVRCTFFSETGKVDLCMQGLIDIHCHIVPGVDDGARNVEEAARMLQQEYKNGVAAVIMTPHYRRGMFETPQREVEKQYRKMWEMARRSRSGMKVYLGGECHTSRELVADLKSGRRPTMAGTRYVLTEFSSMHGFDVLRNQIYELVAAGYIPIVAHAERYPCLLGNPGRIEELRALGAEIQLTSGSILGEEGWREKYFCRKLLKKQWVDYIASDAHNLTDRSVNLQQCAKLLTKMYGEEYVKQIMIGNPMKIIEERRENR